MLAVLDLVLISAFWGLGFSVLIGFRVLGLGFSGFGIKGAQGRGSSAACLMSHYMGVSEN